MRNQSLPRHCHRLGFVLGLSIAALLLLAVCSADADSIVDGVYEGNLSIQSDSLATPAEPGDLQIEGSLDVLGSMQIGIIGGPTPSAAATWLYSETGSNNYSLSVLAARHSVAFLWQDSGTGSVRTKMILSGDNTLSLFNSSGTASIVLNPTTGRVIFSGTGSGLTLADGTVLNGISSLQSTVLYGSGGQVVASGSNGNLAVSGNLTLPVSSGSGSGVILSGTSRLVHSSGTNNLFFGLNAGTYSLTGSGNVGLGTRALDGLTTGYGNFALGTDALGKATSGNVNTAIGSLALSELTSGSNNMAIGAEALKYTTTGWANVAIGVYALFGFNSNEGTAIGYTAGQSATGYGPTFIGAQAGKGITNGVFNTAIGWSSLHTDGTTASTNGSYRTAIGAGAQVTADNTIAIGGTGTFAANTILGGTSAAAKLHVIKDAEQLRLGYDGLSFFSTTVGSAGAVVFNATGTAAQFTFSDKINANSGMTVSGAIRIDRQGDILMGQFGDTE